MPDLPFKTIHTQVNLNIDIHIQIFGLFLAYGS